MRDMTNKNNNPIEDLTKQAMSGITTNDIEALGDVQELTEIQKLQAKQSEHLDDITSNAVVEAARKEAERVIKENAEAIRKAELGNTLLSPEAYTGFTPGIEINPKSMHQPVVVDQTGMNIGARPANAIDLSKLDESNIMAIPFIKAVDNLIPSILFLKPVDPTIRFRWVNFKNYSGGNLGRFKALGFVNACPEDVDQKATPIAEGCIEGTQIKWYDVILMKINVIQLMGLYKRNILSSLNMVGKFQEKARTMAQKQFDRDLSENFTKGGRPLSAVLKQMQSANYDVQFYVPGLSEVVGQDKAFLNDDIVR